MRVAVEGSREGGPAGLTCAVMDWASGQLAPALPEAKRGAAAKMGHAHGCESERAVALGAGLISGNCGAPLAAWVCLPQGHLDERDALSHRIEATCTALNMLKRTNVYSGGWDRHQTGWGRLVPGGVLQGHGGSRRWPT